jgi:uncharacterized membrane protein
MIYLGGLLVALFVLGIPVAVIALLVGQARLRTRVTQLEQRLAQAGVVAPKEMFEPNIALFQDEMPEPEPEPQAVAGAIPSFVPPAPPPASTSPSSFTALGFWLRDNWVYAISAVSLGLAGVFLVQYGAEQGLLPPEARVALAIVLGVVLIGAGEWVRRRHGDEASRASAYVPSVFSGAGLVCIFAAIIAARQLYGLIGAEVTFAGLLGTAVASVILGWFYGPLLASIGLIGAGMTPFLVGGTTETPPWIFAYYGLIAAAGLAVDAIRRWAWVSILALGIGYGGGWLMLQMSYGSAPWTLLLLALPVMAIAIPWLSLRPRHDGAMIAEAVFRGGDAAPPGFPVWLAGGAVALSVAGLVMLVPVTSAEAMLIYAALAVLALGLLIWAADAPGIADLAALPVIGFLIRIVSDGLSGSPLLRPVVAPEAADQGMTWTMTAMVVAATAMTLAAAWRGLRDVRYKIIWGLAAALTAPLAVVCLDIFWSPVTMIGQYPWALLVIALAGVMVGIAIRLARADGSDKRRAAHAGLAALSLIALALFLVFTKTALTLALGVLIIVAAALDRRFRLPEMGLFISAGLVVLFWRLVVDPGIAFALDAPLILVLASYGGASLAALAARQMLSAERSLVRAELSMAMVAFLALLANVLISRWLREAGGLNWQQSHWGLTLQGLPWLGVMLWRLYALPQSGVLRPLIIGVAALAAGLALIPVTAAATIFNPMMGSLQSVLQFRVFGPLIADTLALAYAVPGLMLLIAVPRILDLDRTVRLGLTLIGATLLALYAGLEIRRFWRGDDLWLPGVTQAELYTYTVAMILIGAGLLYQALARQSAVLRRIAMAVIAVTVAKVFLVDASGLTGLTRVFSFLGLGLSLAGLAWLNRWAVRRAAGSVPGDSPG